MKKGLLLLISILLFITFLLLKPILTTKASLVNQSSNIVYNREKDKTYAYGTYLIKSNSIYKVNNVTIKIEIYNDKNELIEYEYYDNQNDKVKYSIVIPDGLNDINVKPEVIGVEYKIPISIDIGVVLLLLFACFLMIKILIIKIKNIKIYSRRYYFSSFLATFILIFIASITLLIFSKVTKVELVNDYVIYDYNNKIYTGEGKVISNCKYKLLSSRLQLNIYEETFDEKHKSVEGKLLYSKDIDVDEMGEFNFPLDFHYKDYINNEYDFIYKYEMIDYKVDNNLHFYIALFLLVTSLYLIPAVIKYKKVRK